MFSALLICLAQAAPAGLTALPKGLLPEETGALGKKRFTYKSAAALNVGSTSNVGQTNGSGGDTFFELTPAVVGQFRTSWRFQAQAYGEGRLRRFTAQEVGDETSGKGGAGLRWWITKNFEVAAKGDVAFVEGLEKTYFSRDGVALKQEYDQKKAHAYVAWHPGRLTLQIGGEATLRDYFTDTRDLLGREFENDFEDYESWFRAGLRLGKSFRIEALSALGRRTFQVRMADYTSGYPIEEGFRHPFAANLYHHHSLGFRARFGKWVTYTQLGGRVEKDQAFGAHDANTYWASQAVEIPVGRAFRLVPEIRAHQKRYANFVDDPLDAQTALDRNKRKDTWGEAGTTFRWQMSPRLVSQAQYTYAMGISNFTAAEYAEHRALLGFSMYY